MYQLTNNDQLRSRGLKPGLAEEMPLLVKAVAIAVRGRVG
jgi:hypothetical protein